MAAEIFIHDVWKHTSQCIRLLTGLNYLIKIIARINSVVHVAQDPKRRSNAVPRNASALDIGRMDLLISIGVGNVAVVNNLTL